MFRTIKFTHIFFIFFGVFATNAFGMNKEKFKELKIETKEEKNYKKTVDNITRLHQQMNKKSKSNDIKQTESYEKKLKNASNKDEIDATIQQMVGKKGVEIIENKTKFNKNDINNFVEKYAVNQSSTTRTLLNIYLSNPNNFLKAIGNTQIKEITYSFSPITPNTPNILTYTKN